MRNADSPAFRSAISAAGPDGEVQYAGRLPLPRAQTRMATKMHTGGRDRSISTVRTPQRQGWLHNDDGNTISLSISMIAYSDLLPVYRRAGARAGRGHARGDASRARASGPSMPLPLTAHIRFGRDPVRAIAIVS